MTAVFTSPTAAGEGPEGEGVQVTMCDLDSEYFGTFGSGGVGDGQFILMSAIAMDNDRGRLYISDEYLHRILASFSSHPEDSFPSRGDCAELHRAS